MGIFPIIGNDNPVSPPPPPPTMFTQEQLNKILADERRKTAQQLETLQSQLTKFQGLETEKTELATQLEETRKQFMTKEELAKDAEAKRQAAHKQQLDALTGDRDNYRSLFEQTLIKRDITVAASEHKAYNPAQLEMLLGGITKVVPVKDDKGSVTGYQVVTQVKVNDKIVELPTAEAVGKMREDKTYSNLFLIDGKPGLGLTINNGSGSSSDSKPPADPAEYRKWYAKQG